MSPSINATLKKMYDEDAQEGILRRMCQPIEEKPIHLKVNPKSAWELLHDPHYRGVDTQDLLDMANTQIGGQQYKDDNRMKVVVDRACAIAVLRGAR